MESVGPGSDESPMSLGTEGEAHFGRLRASVEFGTGFELLVCGFNTPDAFDEVWRRLTDDPPVAIEPVELLLDSPQAFTTIAERLAAISPASSGRKLIWVHAANWDDALQDKWAGGLLRLNERRNLAMRGCPNAIVLAGPAWLPRLVHDVSPDLWSVRAAAFVFVAPASEQDILVWSGWAAWPTGWPMTQDLQPAEYYEELAEALEFGRRPGDQATRGHLLLSASEAWQRCGNTQRAFAAAEKATDAFTTAGDDRLQATARCHIADILAQRGDVDEALRIWREEAVPAFERLGDVRARALTMGRVADVLTQKGEIDEALRIRREEELPEYARLGDERSWAQTMGRIADSLAKRGEYDEALRIQMEDRLPVARRLRDMAMIDHIDFSCAWYRFARGRLSKGQRETMAAELQRIVASLKDLRQLWDMARAGHLLGLVLGSIGRFGEAEAALEQAAATLEALQSHDQARESRALAQRFRDRVVGGGDPAQA